MYTNTRTGLIFVFPVASFGFNHTGNAVKRRDLNTHSTHLPEGTGTGAGPRRREGGLDKSGGSAEHGEEREDTHGSSGWGREKDEEVSLLPGTGQTRQGASARSEMKEALAE